MKQWSFRGCRTEVPAARLVLHPHTTPAAAYKWSQHRRKPRRLDRALKTLCESLDPTVSETLRTLLDLEQSQGCTSCNIPWLHNS